MRDADAGSVLIMLQAFPTSSIFIYNSSASCTISIDVIADNFLKTQRGASCLNQKPKPTCVLDLGGGSRREASRWPC